MPRTDVVFFQEDDDRVPLLEWLDRLVPKAQDKCLARLGRLEQLGHELRRPEADYLEDDIYELRAKHIGVNYRMLYFFHGRRAVVVSHGFTKQQARAPGRELAAAKRRKATFEKDPDGHTFRPEGGHGT